MNKVQAHLIFLTSSVTLGKGYLYNIHIVIIMLHSVYIIYYKKSRHLKNEKYAYILCKDYAIFYKGLEHLQVPYINNQNWT